MGESRNIFLTACGEIADQLQNEGFRSLKSKPYLVKKEADLTFRIRFQSDFRNILLATPIPSDQSPPEDPSLFRHLDECFAESEAFGNVSLLVHAEIAAKSIQSWRMQLPHPVRTHDGVAGTNIGYLAPEDKWLDVNLADPRSRSTKVTAVIQLIRTVALPYFDQFRKPGRVVAALARADIPGLWPTLNVEYAACYGSRNDALLVLKRILVGAPDYFLNGYAEAIEEFRRVGFPAPNTIFGKPGADLAFAALALDLEPISVVKR